MTDGRADLAAAQRRIEEFYFGPEVFGRLSEIWSTLLTDYLSGCQHSRGRVLNWIPPEQNVAAAGSYLDGASKTAATVAELAERFRALAVESLGRGQNLHDPRYIGHQVPPPSPVAGLFDALGTVTNQVMAVYEMGPWATAVERALIARWGAALGFTPGTFSGLVTSGGSLANLTALLTARNVALRDGWERGIDTGQTASAMVVHADAHYGIARAAGILGLGTDSVVRAPLDARRRMDPHQLDDLLRGLVQKKIRIIAVVACACATPIGAFDDLIAISEICRRHGVWLHVDAAHGGGVAFSGKHRRLLDGLSLADSVICDAHKMLFVPALCAFVFYRNAAHRFEAFRQDAPYLFDPSNPGAAEFDGGLSTLECTKRASAMGLWGFWSLFGNEAFADFVDVTFAAARTLYDLLQEAPDFEPLHEPEANIVVFRHVPAALRSASTAALGDFNRELRQRVIHSGAFYLAQTTLEGAGALRCTVMNPLTREPHLRDLLESLRRTAAEMLSESGASAHASDFSDALTESAPSRDAASTASSNRARRGDP